MKTPEGRELFDAIVGFVFGFLLARLDEILAAIKNRWHEFWAYRRFKKAMKAADDWETFV